MRVASSRCVTYAVLPPLIRLIRSRANQDRILGDVEETRPAHGLCSHSDRVWWRRRCQSIQSASGDSGINGTRMGPKQLGSTPMAVTRTFAPIFVLLLAPLTAFAQNVTVPHVF